MESKDPKEDKKRHDEDYTAMNDMMKLDDIHDRAKVSIRVKNEALAKVVRLQVMRMRYNRSKQGASASKQENMIMANLIKQEEHEKRMHAKAMYEQTVSICEHIIQHMHSDAVDWFALVDGMVKKHEQNKEQKQPNEHGAKETHEPREGDWHEMDEAEQKASSREKPTWFDWDELDVKEKEERRKEWRSSSSISLKVIANEDRIKQNRWMRKQDWKDLKAMKERMSKRTLEARGCLLIWGYPGN